MRLTPVYDGRDEHGRPFAHRPPVAPEVLDDLLHYLESAPLVLAARSFGEDEYAPADIDVPLTFHTDGVWIWGGVVAHYLRKHGLAPHPELVTHIVNRSFEISTVGEETKSAAVRIITGG
ncbi:hypothetical protein ABZ319_10675 [Nocardia sp. NPDC005978]|uniref:hypothetical protein n=1 Tax=Nocardia sp. NPDC005978 TaxID=3156725 RepID=UPI0033A5CFE8